MGSFPPAGMLPALRVLPRRQIPTPTPTQCLSRLKSMLQRNGEVCRLWQLSRHSVTDVCGAENIYVVGSISQLSNWNPNNAIALSPNNYPTWSGKSPPPTAYALLMSAGSDVDTPGGYNIPIQIYPDIQWSSDMGERPE